MGGWGLRNPFLERIEKPVRKIGPPLTMVSDEYTHKFVPSRYTQLPNVLLMYSPSPPGNDILVYTNTI